METILTYFPGLTLAQQHSLGAMEGLYQHWNARINVISRKDMEAFYLHHVLHSMAIAKLISFRPGTRVLDVGTGGGFPGIPLAICFPDCHFTLVDSIGKKIRVVQDVADSLGLRNVEAMQVRVEEMREKFDFVVSRAVTTLPVFWSWVEQRIAPQGINDMSNGALYLKGGDFSSEIQQLKAACRIFEISAMFDIPYFAEKKVVHISNRSQK